MHVLLVYLPENFTLARDVDENQKCQIVAKPWAFRKLFWSKGPFLFQKYYQFIIVIFSFCANYASSYFCEENTFLLCGLEAAESSWRPSDVKFKNNRTLWSNFFPFLLSFPFLSVCVSVCLSNFFCCDFFSPLEEDFCFSLYLTFFLIDFCQELQTDRQTDRHLWLDCSWYSVMMTTFTFE